MLIAITSTASIGAFTTETPNLIIKSERAYVRICDKGVVKRLILPYSYEQNLSTMTTNAHHN